MLENIGEVDEMRSLARRKRQPNEHRTIQACDLDAAQKLGWEIDKRNKRTIRLLRAKQKHALLEDRVWHLLYRLGFSHLCGEGGGQLAINAQDGKSPTSQIDVVGLDDEVAVAIECKSAAQPRKRPDFQKDIAKHALIRERFARAVNAQFPLDHKRVPVLVIFTWDLILTDNDIERARIEKIVLLNEHDLNYYEQLTSHLGPAAKYQFYVDILPQRRIQALEVHVPALQTKMGRNTCYTFSITPEYLLKIAYVAHRAKGHATDINKYQRMIKKSRLRKIREYISERGIFPTNIVINFEGRRHVRFEQRKQKGGPEGARYGTLHLTPSYGSAWIIDGQHRLFAYSGHERARTSHLNVLAFQGLPPGQQAQLFIDINHEQKSVKRSLLHELYAELNWEAHDEGKRISAIVSKAVQALNEQKDSRFYGRILLADDARTPTRCISLESMFRALNQPGMFIVKAGVEYGPLWAGTNDRTLRRALRIMKAWFDGIYDGAQEWWDLGAGEGGGLAMNDGATICVAVMKSVFQDRADKLSVSLVQLSDDELAEEIQPYASRLGAYFGGLSAEERRAFRAGARGVQGQTAGRRQCEAMLHEEFLDFEPPGLKEDLALQAGKTNEKAYAIIQQIEKRLHSIVLDALKAEYGGDDEWWYQAVPQKIRRKVVERIDEEQGKGGREDYFDLIDFRTMALKNWSLFQDVLAYGKSGNKDKRTEWIVKLNDLRKVVMHPGKSRVIAWDELALLKETSEWLERCVLGVDA